MDMVMLHCKRSFDTNLSLRSDARSGVLCYDWVVPLRCTTGDQRAGFVSTI